MFFTCNLNAEKSPQMLFSPLFSGEKCIFNEKENQKNKTSVVMQLVTSATNLSLTEEFLGTQTGRHKQSPISLHKLCQGNGTLEFVLRTGDGKAAFPVFPINIS